MRTFLIADTHWYHHNIKRYCGRPDNFEELIFENWNSIVKDEDEIIHLGDVIFGGTELLTSILKNLKGIKHLVVGNHDKRGKVAFLKAGFTTMQESLVRDQVLFTHRPKGLSAGIAYNVFGHIHNSPLTTRDYDTGIVITDKHKVFTTEHHYSPILLEDFMKDDSNLAIKRIIS